MGKIKLSLEPEQEEGALVYFDRTQDNAIKNLTIVFLEYSINIKQYHYYYSPQIVITTLRLPPLLRNSHK